MSGRSASRLEGAVKIRELLGPAAAQRLVKLDDRQELVELGLGE